MILHWLAFTLKVLLQNWREYNLETHFICLDYEKAFKEVRPLLLSIPQARKNPNPLLTPITNIYENNKKIKLDTTVTQPTKINKEAWQGWPPFTDFNIYESHITTEWKEEIKE